MGKWGVSKDWKYVKQLTGMGKKEMEKYIKEKFEYKDLIEAYSSI